MATITVNQYNDDGTTARTAGETLTINSGIYTQRTDSRWYNGAPTSMTGAIAAITINEGEYYINAQNVRWLAYDTGTGNVPAIGTTITQGGVSGYLLGVWATLLTAPTAVAAAMPTEGFLKFREVTGGVFTSGNLSGIGAYAVSDDVTGWLEVVMDQSGTITVPRLGKFTTRGSYFYLDNTTGVRGQVLQTPINGGGANTFAPGVEIETAPSSGIYEKYPALNAATNGWSVINLGQAQGESDARQKYVKMLTNGQMQIGEQVIQTETYAHVAAQASTYASLTRAGTYTWIDNMITVYCSGGHFLEDGQQTGIDFTSGTAPDGIYTVSVLDPYYFTVIATGSGVAGTCNSREGVAVTFTAHTLNIGDKVYLTPSTGTLPAGEREIYANSANIYWVKYPHTSVLTSGATTAIHTITITSTAHGLAIGNRVYVDFTTGTAPDGVYTIRAVTANTYTINCPLSAVTSGSFTSYHDIGFVPVSGCKTRIPNIIGRQCVNTTRAINAAPHATITTRPEFATTSAGYIDTEYMYSDWYYNLSQPYYVKIKNSWIFDALSISECAIPMEIVNNGFGMHSALNTVPITLTSNFAGGVFDYNRVNRGNANSNGHAINISYCNNMNLTGNICSIITYARSSGFPIIISYCSGLNFYNTEVLNGNFKISASSNINIYNTDYCDRNIGYTNATSGYYVFSIDTLSSNFMIDGITFGKNNTLINNHAYSGIVYVGGGSNNFKIRNIGTPSVPLLCGSFHPNLYGFGSLLVFGGNNYNYKIQRLYIDRVRTSLISTSNAEKTAIYESVHCKSHYQMGGYAISTPAFASLNSEAKGIGMLNETTGNASVYGQSWRSLFGLGMGRLVLCMNEPSVETAGQISVVSGTAKFNSSGGVILPTIGNEVIWETPHWVLGHSGICPREELLMSGGTNTNYNIRYALDTGSGYSSWKNLSYCPSATSSGTSGQYTITLVDTTGISVNDYVYGTNVAIWAKVTQINSSTVITVDTPHIGTVSGVLRFNQMASDTIPPTGFKLKIKITTRATNTTAITFLRLNTITSWADQTTNQYPLDVSTLTLTGLRTGSEIRCYSGVDPATSVLLDGIESSGTSFILTHSLSNVSGYIQIFALGYQPIKLDITYTTTNTSIPIQQVIDRVYINA